MDTFGGAWDPSDMVIPDVVVIRGSKTMVSAEHSGLVLHFLSPVIVTNAAYVSMPGSSLDLQAAPVISGGGRVEVSGGFFVSVPLDLANGGQVRVDGAVTSSVPVTVSGSTLAVDELWAPGFSVVSGGSGELFGVDGGPDAQAGDKRERGGMGRWDQ